MDGRRLTKILTYAMPHGNLTEPYVAWDKLRHYEPPSDLSHEEWWYGIKLGRRSALRTINELRDISGQPLSYSLPDEILAALDEITRDASGQVAIDELVTNPLSRDRYIVSSLMEEAITSSQLEGAATTRRVAKDMIRSGRRPRDRSERMIFNNWRAMQRMLELRDAAITPELVCEIQRIVTEGTLDNPDGAGRLQDDDAERIAVHDEFGQRLHTPPPVDELSERLQRLCAFANATTSDTYMPPVLRAIAVHFMVGYDHYFEDGNGRTARALFYWVMLKNGYWLTEFLSVSRILKRAPAQYGRSFLLTEQDDGDLTHFFIHHLGVIKRAIGDLHDYLAVKIAEQRELTRRMRSLYGQFNHRELALLEHATRDPGSLYTVRSHSTSHHISGETARHDLIHLAEQGLLERAKRGKEFVWTPVADLTERLGA